MRPTTAFANTSIPRFTAHEAAETDDNFALIREHRSNISRYRRLLKTDLTELERRFLERRLTEEQSALEKIVASTFPLTFKMPASPNVRIS
jgi:hypothetical protein